MASRAYGSGQAGTTGLVRSAFAGLLVTLALAVLAAPADAYLLSDDRPHNPCRIVSSVESSGDACGWTFEGIARVQSIAHGASEALANRGRLKRLGFETSDLTIEDTLTELASGRAGLLPWDREIGIADELMASMGVSVDTASLSSDHFLLMPATFNEAYLSDFVDFTACQTAYTFIFAGALDGRSDAPYVTHRWEEMKVDVCLDFAGADCSKAELEVEPARLYFHSNWPCRYTPRRTGVDRGLRGG